MKKIILAFDSFKGSLSSEKLSQAATEAIISEIPDCNVIALPIADGGEGTTVSISSALKAHEVVCHVSNPIMKPIVVPYAITKDGKTAIMEMAAASGLPLLSKNYRNPLKTTTYGTGQLIADAISKGCTTIILGIGGSATNDGAIGLLSALGVKFYDTDGKELAPIGENLLKINDFDATALVKIKQKVKFIVACDVNNPLYGENGAAYIYAPQKGASKEDVIILDAGLKNYAEVIARKLGKDISNEHGAGAAGGMGGGLLAFLDAELKSGIDTILDIVDFDEQLQECDLVITGEGKIDAQTGMGKALGGILSRSERKNVPVVVVAGAVDGVKNLNEQGFTSLFSIQPAPVTLEKAMDSNFAYNNIKNEISQIVRLIKRFEK
ncbi:MAG: glycerate kinase [Muribaculaceae bacterium]|nr:glycerate kinase [Muribaculaceae bacterium]